MLRMGTCDLTDKSLNLSRDIIKLQKQNRGCCTASDLLVNTVHGQSGATSTDAQPQKCPSELQFSNDFLETA